MSYKPSPGLLGRNTPCSRSLCRFWSSQSTKYFKRLQGVRSPTGARPRDTSQQISATCDHRAGVVASPASTALLECYVSTRKHMQIRVHTRNDRLHKIVRSRTIRVLFFFLYLPRYPIFHGIHKLAINLEIFSMNLAINANYVFGSRDSSS